MTFLRDLHGTLSFGEIISVYQHACDLDSTPLTDPGPSISSCAIKWEDALVEVLDRDSDGWKLSQRYGFLSGAERAFGDVLSDARSRTVQEAGNMHGVSHDTTPLP